MKPVIHKLFQHIEYLFKQGDARVSHILYSKTGEQFYIFQLKHGENGNASHFAVCKDGVSGVALGTKSPVKLPFPHQFSPKGLSPDELRVLQELRECQLFSYLKSV